MKNNIILFQSSLLNNNIVEDIVKCNEKTIDYGLKLTKTDAKSLIETRDVALNKNGRIEFGGDIIIKIVEEFCESPYISQYNYVDTINELIEIFYYYKNETLEEIGDDDLIHLMKILFNGRCQGSLDLLKGKELYRIAENIKYNNFDFTSLLDDEVN